MNSYGSARLGDDNKSDLALIKPGGAEMSNRRDEEEAHKHAFTPYPLAEAESAEEFYTPATAVNWEAVTSEELPLDRESFMLDIDRMVNEGLGGGQVTEDNGHIGESTTDSMVRESHDDPEGEYE